MGKLGVREKSLIHQVERVPTSPVPGFGTSFLPFAVAEDTDDRGDSFPLVTNFTGKPPSTTSVTNLYAFPTVEADDGEQGVPGGVGNFGGSTGGSTVVNNVTNNYIATAQEPDDPTADFPGPNNFGNIQQQPINPWPAEDLENGFVDWDDFMWDSFATITNTGVSGRKSNYTGAGTTGFVTPHTLNQGPGMQGVVQLGTGTNTAGNAFVLGLSGAGIQAPNLQLGDGTLTVDWFFKTDTNLSSGTDRYTLQFGLGDGSNGPANLIYATYRDNINGGAFIIQVTVASVAQASANGVTALVAATKYHVRLVITTTDVKLYLATYGNTLSLEATYSGSQPASSVGLGPQAQITKSVGTTLRSVYLDGWQINYQLTTKR